MPDFAQGLRALYVRIGYYSGRRNAGSGDHSHHYDRSETGHLVMATLHASNAIQTVERIIDVFPPHQQAQIRIQLANTILGIFSQQLVPKADESGRVLASEVLVANPAVRNLIRENKAHQLQTVMQTGASQGMITMEKSWQLSQIGHHHPRRNESSPGHCSIETRGLF